jgi:hypothetical protein
MSLRLAALGSQAVTILSSTVITTAASGVASTPIVGLDGMTYLLVQANFTYGSGGTSVAAYIQTSLDQGATWIDVMEFGFTTANGRLVSSVISASVANVAALDGSLSAGTVQNGILGDRVRVKYTSVGTYAGTTTLQVTGLAKAA